MAQYLNLESGKNFFVVSSLFQKSIRRGLEEEAIWCASEFYISGYANYAWKRMLIMVSEDVGLANPQLPQQMSSLYELYTTLKSMKDKGLPEKLPFVQAVLMLVRSPKSRLVDNKLCAYFDCREEMEEPNFQDFKKYDWVYDMHTSRGKRLGRGNKHFFEVAGHIENDNLQEVPDEYKFRDFVAKLYEKKDEAEKQQVKVRKSNQTTLDLTDD